MRYDDNGTERIFADTAMVGRLRFVRRHGKSILQVRDFDLVTEQSVWLDVPLVGHDEPAEEVPDGDADR